VQMRNVLRAVRGVTWVSAFGGCQQYLPNKIKFCPTKRGVDSSSTHVFANVYYEYAIYYYNIMIIVKGMDVNTVI
jgi:hypothetical protein